MSTTSPETPAPAAPSLLRFGPLGRSEMLALKYVRQKDGESGRRMEQAAQQYHRMLEAEQKATEKRWDELVAAVVGKPVDVPPGHDLFDVVENGETFLVVRPIGEQSKGPA